MGQTFDQAVIARVDQGLGLLLRLPTEPESAVGFCHISNLADGQLGKGEIEKRFKVGGLVKGRVIGFRLVDALVAMSLKESVLAQQVYSVKDLYPGQHLEVTVLDNTSAGLVVQITPNLKGLVPKTHMSDSGVLPEGSKLPSKLKPGKNLEARVLSVDPVAKRVQLTLKKGLVGSKLPVLSDLRQAAVGMKLHGVVTGVKGFGVFVGFYGGVSGLLPKAHLDLLPGQEPGDLYSVGQLLRCQVASVDLRKGGLVLKPSSKKAADEAAAAAAAEGAAAAAAADPWGGLAAGSLLPEGAVVQQVLLRPAEQGGGLVELTVTGSNGQSVLAHLPAAHLSDHPGGAEGLISILKPGITLPGPLLVLQQRRVKPNTQGLGGDRWQGGSAEADDQQQQQQQQRQGDGVPLLLLTRKASLVAAAAAGQLPASVAEVAAGAVLPGYVASVTRDAVFVRFLGRCTGRAGLPQLSDTFVTDPARHFSVGQSVVASVVAVEGSGSGEGSGAAAAAVKFAVTLKPSVVGSHEGKFLASLLSDLELAYQLQQLAAEAAAAEAAAEEAEEASTPTDWAVLPPGGTVDGTLHELRSYGAVIDIDAAPDVVGLVTPEHGGTADLEGSEQLQLCVLDVVKTQGLVELSLLPELINMQQPAAAAAGGSSSSKKAAKRAAADEQQQQQLAVGQEVQAMVHFIKDHYVVASIVQQQQQQRKKAKNNTAAAAAGSTDVQQQQQQYGHHGIGFIARGDFNSQGPAGREARKFAKSQVVAAKVAALPSVGNGGRLLLELNQPLLPSKGVKGAAAAGTAAATGGSGSKPAAGAVVTAVVVAVHELELEMAVGKAAATAHLHVSELQERLTAPPSAPNGNPLSQFKVQQQLPAAWLGHVRGLGHKRGKEPQLSIRPSVLAAAKQQGAGKAKLAPVLTAAELHPGLKVVGWVCGITKDALWLSLAPEIKGRVHLLESAEHPEALAAGFEQRFSIGQGLAAVVLGMDAKQHTLDLSLRADRLRKAIADPAAAAAAAAGSAAAAADKPSGDALVPGRIVSVAGSGVVVQLGPKTLGVVALTDIHDTWVPNALAGFSAGVYVRARVLAADGAEPRSGGGSAAAAVDSKGRVLLSLKPSQGGLLAAEEGTAEAAALAAAVAANKKQQQGAAAAADGLLQADHMVVGSKVQGYVRSVSTKGLFVTLDRCRDARVKLSQLSDGFVEDPAAAFPVGSRVEGRIVSVENTKPPPAGAAAAAAAAADDGVRVELSLRSGDGPGQLRTIADIQEGELTTGKVRRVERYGVFVELSRSRVSGLVHVSKAGLPGHVKEKDLAAAFNPGQAVRVRVLSVDAANNKVSLSMQPELLVGSDDDEEEEQQQGAGKKRVAADFDDEMVEAMEAADDSGDEDEEDDDAEEESEEGGGLGLDDIDVSDEEADKEEEEEEEEDDDSEQQLGSEDAAGGSSSEEDASEQESEEDEDESDEEEDAAPGLLGANGAAPAAAAADWGELQLQDAADGSDQAAAANGTGELSRGEKKRLKAAREAELRAAERARLAGEGPPESAAGYEQSLLSEPNSSFLWVKYMAFQLKLGEVDAARQVAERALRTIAMTSERDKFNVWVALMNLENAYGGAQAEDAVMGVFKRAVGYCEPKPLYLALLGILERSRRWQLAADVWRTATKKFNTSCKVWMGAYESALQAASRAAAEDAEQLGSSTAAAADGGAAARQVLERALKSLPQRKHVKALLRAGLAEFRLGCAERGRSILEGLLANHPKRTDIWNVYIDQEVKGGDVARTRALLSRATSLSLPPKKMKVLFRRWLEWEQAHGSAADVAAVKQRAVEYMESQALRND